MWNRISKCFTDNLSVQLWNIASPNQVFICILRIHRKTQTWANTFISSFIYTCKIHNNQYRRMLQFKIEFE